MDVIIRKEDKNDYTEVYDLHKLAFGRDGEAKLVDALRSNKEVFIPELSLVATIDGLLVGHILLSKISITDSYENEFESLALAPMTVRPEFQKKGIGRILISHALEIAAKLNFKSVIVLGHETYYPKFGFSAAKSWGIKPPFDVPENTFMGLELIKDGLRNVSGTVNYPKEFWMV